MNPPIFLVTRSRGPAWVDTQPLETQDGWTAHAAFMDGLVDNGFVLLGGPIVGTRDVCLGVRANDAAEIEAQPTQDPWRHQGLLVDVSIQLWTIRLGHLPQ